MRDLPSGTVTFLFTDIEGSTRLLHELGDDYASVLAEHRRRLRAAAARHGGAEVDTQGDAFFFAFARASDAVAAAGEGRSALATGPVRVRMGIHTGEPAVTDEGYVGVDVHKAARIASSGHGGQILLSQATRDLVDADVRDLGRHRLKDLSTSERIYQLGSGKFSPLRTLYRTNLPVVSTPFLGRDQELATVTALLARDAIRLLTLTGAGGAGKTRLAIQAAAALAENYPDGVWWVSLASLRDPALVLPEAERVLDCRERLSEHIGDRRMLLVLDNFEQVVRAAHEVAELLAACPHLEAIVTSRERLHVSGEQIYAVPPLEEADGAALFTERAAAIKPDSTPDTAVALICRRLDNLPLAIELAAARVNVLSPVAILERLGERLPLLTGGPGDAPERQRTLRATIDWSYQLLAAEEQRLLARLAVFTGGCTSEAAEYVCEADLERLASLVDKSLLRHTEGRYWMLETIREYALTLDRAVEYDTTMRRLGEYLVELVESPLNGTTTAQEGATKRLRELAPEFENVRTALAWALAAGEGELAVRLAINAGWSFAAGRFVYEQAGWLNEALQMPGVSPRTRASGLHVAAVNASFRGDYQRASELSTESLAIARELGDDDLVAENLTALGWAAWGRGDYALGRVYYEECIALAKRMPSAERTCKALHGLGELERRAGKLERSRALLEESAAIAREIGHGYQLTTILHGLGDVALAEGNPSRASSFYGDALGHLRELAPWIQRPAVYCIAGLAAAAATGGDTERAGRLWGGVSTLEREFGPLTDEPLYRDALHASSEASPLIFAAATEHGRRMTTDEIILYALEAAVSSGHQ
jgi:predicted ATPase